MYEVIIGYVTSLVLTEKLYCMRDWFEVCQSCSPGVRARSTCWSWSLLLEHTTYRCVHTAILLYILMLAVTCTYIATVSVLGNSTGMVLGYIIQQTPCVMT